MAAPLRNSLSLLFFITCIFKFPTPSSALTPPSNNIGNDITIDIQSSTTTTTTQPPVIPVDDDSPVSSVAVILAYFNTTGTTCCHIQTKCQGCRNFYDVNGIRYCCPACMGQALVTNLVCNCYPPSNFDASLVHCKVNNTKVVGGYFPWRPSYFSADCNTVTPCLYLLATVTFMFSICLFTF